VDFDGAEFKRPDVIVYGNQHTQTMKKMLVLNSVTYAVSIQSQNKKNALAYYFSITTLHKIGLDYHWNTHPFNGPLSGTTQVSRYQKGKTNLDFTEARDSEWQWH